ncbi:MAG: cytochrome P450 [Actinomycetia bacterium]|nr:cytochrome P450 [Actinomycetes bacterium]
MIGVPEDEADLFRHWVFRNFQLAPRDNEVKRALQLEMWEYFDSLLVAREAEPRDDLATLLTTAEMGGQPLDRETQIGYLGLLILAGIDTTWSSIGSGLWHFATHDDDRNRLADLPFEDPLWDMANEEVLRFYSPVTMARQVVADTHVGGREVHEGDQVLLTFPAANRDPEVFDHAADFVLGRAANRHSAFRSRHPPVPGLEPGPARDAGGLPGVGQGLPELHPRRPGACHLGQRPGAGPSQHPGESEPLSASYSASRGVVRRPPGTLIPPLTRPGRMGP